MRHSYFGKTTAAAAVILILCLLTSCFGRENFIQSVMLTSDVRGAFEIDPADHASVFGLPQLSAASGGYAFYFDDKTGNAGVYDSVSGELWSALPTFLNRDAAVVAAEAFNGTATYILNSQDHAAAFGTVAAEKNGSEIRVFFAMADKETTARKKPNELVSGDIYIGIPVVFTFEGSRLSVSVDMAEVVVSPGLILCNIRLLPDFGCISRDKKQEKPEGSEPETQAAAEYTDGYVRHYNESTEEPENGDFVLVPDGCGAVIHTGDGEVRYPELDFCVYGSDDGLGRNASLGAFGIRRGTGAFVCVSTEGDELAVIKTTRYGGNRDARYLAYAQYQVVPVFNNNGNMSYGIMYKGILRQTYSFLNGSSADYPGMAAAARELLVLAGWLPASSGVGDFPVNIELTGSVDGKKDTLLTTFEQAESILSQMKAKGTGKVNLILNGFFDGGAVGETFVSHTLLPFTGGADALGELCAYAGKQNYDIYMGVNIAASSKASSVSRGLDGVKSVYEYKNVFFPVGSESYALKRLSPGTVGDNATGFLSGTEALGMTGYAFADSGMDLSADYTVRLWSRTAVSDMQSSAAASFASVKKLLAAGGSFYIIRHADVVTELPYYTSVTPNASYEAVPFLQMILHSGCVYSGAAVVSADAGRTELLKAVEYGGVPYFSWTGSRSERSYDSFISSAAEMSRRMAEELGDLLPARITGHGKTEEGVYCTQYNGSSLVYVNYNNYSVTVGNVVVPPYDYVRIG